MHLKVVIEISDTTRSLQPTLSSWHLLVLSFIHEQPLEAASITPTSMPVDFHVSLNPMVKSQQTKWVINVTHILLNTS